MAIKKIKDIESRRSFDLPTLLRKPSSCIEHVNDIISSKVTFIYRILSDKKRKFYKGRFYSIDKENNIIIRLLSSPQNPENYVNNVLEIMYSFRMDRIEVFETTILKYLHSKQGGKNIPMHMFLIKLPTSIKLDETIKSDDKREDVRFDVDLP